MKLLTGPASRGVSWMLGGFQVFARQPLATTALFMAFLFGLMLLISLPGIGALLALVLVPAANVGFVLASQAVQAGRVPSPALLVAALRGARPRTVVMLQLGLAYAMAALLAMWLIELIDPDFDASLAEFMKQTQGGNGGQLPDTGVQRGLLMRLLLPLPVTLLFWHAPMVVYRSHVGVAQALFASGVACWRNRGAFLLYGLAWGLLPALLGLVLLAFFSFIGQPQLAVLPLVPLLLMCSTAFYASLHFTVADCFEFDAPPGPQA
jgi:hypothetical protein